MESKKRVVWLIVAVAFIGTFAFYRISNSALPWQGQEALYLADTRISEWEKSFDHEFWDPENGKLAFCMTFVDGFVDVVGFNGYTTAGKARAFLRAIDEHVPYRFIHGETNQPDSGEHFKVSIYDVETDALVLKIFFEGNRIRTETFNKYRLSDSTKALLTAIDDETAGCRIIPE